MQSYKISIKLHGDHGYVYFNRRELVFWLLIETLDYAFYKMKEYLRSGDFIPSELQVGENYGHTYDAENLTSPAFNALRLVFILPTHKPAIDNWNIINEAQMLNMDLFLHLIEIINQTVCWIFFGIMNSGYFIFYS
ncbi:hypothetical protein [Klebsiella aerogenes]|uniref:hypothetical protein n=1 Tax=Klebsiella aerogenes TaxID=548 RepID=UPI002D806156|nr:hypothetical protein [Klebsiella aerogenes]